MGLDPSNKCSVMASKDMGKPSNRSQKAKEARDLARTHTEWFAYKDWWEIENSLSEVGIRPGDLYNEKAYQCWKSWRIERKPH